jgi:DNA (cytosine-5)-methyltransferase 1
MSMGTDEHPPAPRLRSVDLCSGAGGLALGLEQAGFDPVLLIENQRDSCNTLRVNRPSWDVREMDLTEFDPVEEQHVYDVDLLSAGLPRVKATATVHRTRGSDPELKLLEATVQMAIGIQPRAILIENVPNLVSDATYTDIRDYITKELEHLGYELMWSVLNAADYRVPQDRKQGIVVAMKDEKLGAFSIPPPVLEPPVTVGDALGASMAARGWPQADTWARQATRLAPTLVGGSWERGGPDLGPSGSKRAWERMAVNGGTIADHVPDRTFVWDPDRGREGMVKLTVEQAALLQGFPEEWQFTGRKTVRYRQVGHASPPPVGHALGLAIRAALDTK